MVCSRMMRSFLQNGEDSAFWYRTASDIWDRTVYRNQFADSFYWKNIFIAVILGLVVHASITSDVHDKPCRFGG